MLAKYENEEYTATGNTSEKEDKFNPNLYWSEIGCNH